MSNEIVLTPKYWDCECAENYIHPRSVSSCAICKSRRSEQPQSRVNEVVAHGLPLMPARRPTKRAVDAPCAECGGAFLHKEGCSQELSFFESAHH